MGPVYSRRHNISSNLNPAFLACDAVISILRGFALRPFCSPPLPTQGSELSMRISQLKKSTPYMRTFSTNHHNREHNRDLLSRGNLFRMKYVAENLTGNIPQDPPQSRTRDLALYRS